MQPTSPRPPSLIGHPGYLAAQVAKSAGRLLDEALTTFGVRPHHFAVLAALADLGPQCQQDLCDSLDLDKSHMVGFIDDLEALGYITKQRDSADRRRYRVAITEAGLPVLAQMQDEQRRYEDRLFGHLTAQERDDLVSRLLQVVSAADAQRLGVDSFENTSVGAAR